MTKGNRINGFYKLNDDRDDVIVYDDSEFDYTYLAPMTAFFAVAYANNNNAKITFTPLNEEEHEGEEPEVPLGEGALLLIGFGAAYAMTRRKKED